MKIYAPKYYSKFKCISSKCTHSCCIGWEIDVDKATLRKYKTCKHPYAKDVFKSIAKKPTPHFKLCKNGNCPHLDENGLCKVISNLGENYLCNISKEHPRFYNQTPYGLEVGLGVSCEEACRIILNSNDFNLFEEVEKDASPIDKFDFNPIPLRNQILDIIARKDLNYQEKIQIISNEFSISIQSISDKNWKNLLNSLEYLDNSHKELFLCFTTTYLPTQDKQIYLERILAYFVYRYVSKARSLEEIKQYLGLCMFLEKLVCSLIESKNASNLEEIIPLIISVSEEIEYSEDNIDEILFDLI
ncbi:MAG: flagellin lysine-N-methylase [Clostridia bacterium]|nr:flagellin lysine-N-methylase [Clostridia bacterium]